MRVDANQEILETSGSYLAQAIGDTAFELGGEYLELQALRQAKNGTLFPDASALILLESVSPGAARQTMERFKEIGIARQQAELAEQNRKLPKLRKLGYRILRILE